MAALGTGATDLGFIGFMALLLACGMWVMIDVLRKAGTGAGLEAFARANDLELTRSLAAREYAGSHFRSGERIVLRSLRTRTTPVLEVGDTWPTDRIRVRVSSSGAVNAANAPSAEAFLRVVLPGRGRTPPADGAPVPMTSELDVALGGFLGAYSLEVHGGELTVMGSQPLEPDRPERVTAAFDLAASLARLAEAQPPAATDAPSASAHGRARGGTRRRSRHPLAIIGAVLALFLVVPVGFAIVMSILDDHLGGGEGAARIVIGLLIAGITAVVALVLRWATTGRRRSRDEAAEAAPRRDRRSLRRGAMR